MNDSSPNLLTLLAWAERLAAGERCPPWESWCAASPEAAQKWERVVEAQEVLASGAAADNGEPAISAEDLAQFVEGRLPPLDCLRVEQACWQSTALLAELLSTARFIHQPLTVATSWELESRLVALLPPPKPQCTNGKPKFRLGASLPPEAPPDAAPQTAAPPTLLPAQPAAGPRSTSFQWHWPLAAAALLISIVVSGAVGWFAATWHNADKSQQPIAGGPSDNPPPASPRIVAPPPAPVPRIEPSTRPTDDSSLTPPEPSPTPLDRPAPTDGPSPPSAPNSGSAAPRISPPAVPKHRPRVALPTPELAFHSSQGVLLVDPGQRGTWRVAPASIALSEPLKVLSLAESWTTAEVPGVGTLIWEGNSAAELSTLADGTIEILLVHGRIGIDNLQADAQIRLLTADAAWSVRGTADRSTLAIVCDPISPGLLVTRGAIVIDDQELVSGQLSRWEGGAPQSPQPISAAGAASGSQAVLSPPAMNAWDLAWLQAPDENAKRQWRAIFGRLVDRLVAVDDAGAELPKLLAATREPRQAALLARWNVAAAAPAEKSQKTWDLLVERRAPVRVAGVKCLLELPPGDDRLQEMNRFILAKVGPATAERIHQWHASAWQPGAPPKAQADEIVAHLRHNELAVRQIAVSFLELHTAVAFQKLGMLPPAYDATATTARRDAAQVEWIKILTELYSPTRKAPAAFTPRQLLQNAAPGGT